MPRALVLPAASAALVFPLAWGRGGPPPSGGGKAVLRGFPILPPVPTADPMVRSEKRFRVPSRLRVFRLDRWVGVEAVPGALETVEATVGKDMVTGLRYEVRVYRHGKLVLSGPGGMQGGPDATYGQVAATVGKVGSKDFQPGDKYTVELHLTLFETDIPTQHMWAPDTGRYKVLWSKTLTLVSNELSVEITEPNRRSRP
jgi:hypothetical protein